MRLKIKDTRMAQKLIGPGMFATTIMLTAGFGVAEQSKDDVTLDKVQAEFSETFETIGQYTAQERDEALEAMDSALDRMDGQIEKLEHRVREEWADMSQSARETTSAALREMRERRNRLSQAYGALSQGTGTAWDDLMQGVRAGWKDLEEAWDDAAEAMTPEDEKEGN